MKALITGASSGIGRDMARCLSEDGWELILVARREERLLELASEFKTKTRCIKADLSKESECVRLYKEVKGESIDLLINGAGFGYCGEFIKSSLKTDMEMLDTNVRAVHILTKLFLRDFVRRDRGRILNIASSAGFLPGPNMAVYYASKNYVLRFTEAIYEELRRRRSKVRISVLCPGPVDTEFNKVASVKFGLNGLSSEFVAEYALEKAFDNKLIIIPGFVVRLGVAASRFVSEKMLCKIVYGIQKRKMIK